MKAMIVARHAPIDDSPLEMAELPDPEPGADEVRLRVSVCALCHTDLHVVEGELTHIRDRVVPGHQIIGTVDRVGDGATRYKVGDRLGVPWLYSTDQSCAYCRGGRENLCDHIRFTGKDVNGGYAEYVVVPQDYAYAIPSVFSDIQAAPLLCAGVIGYRALRLSEIKPGGRLGMWGFGASAHITIQVARHIGCDVAVFTRNADHQNLARELGATYAGVSAADYAGKLDGAIIFAPAGGLVLDALRALDKGGTLALAGVYMTPIPEIDYNNLLYWERTVRSVANSTREDAIDLLRVAAEIPVRIETTLFALPDLNRALTMLKHSQFAGAGVVNIGQG